MEALAALSVAAAVAQFTDFTAKLLSTGAELYSAASGATADNMAFEDVYSKLQELASELGNSAAAAQNASSAASPNDTRAQATRRLGDLAAQSRQDCDALLQTLDGLKVKGKGKLWGTIKASLANARKRSKIKGLDERLERSQRAMILEVVALVR